jgi:hypothetical protein
MATSQTPEESARVILAIIAEKQISSGDHLAIGQVYLSFLTQGKMGADFIAGMQHAIEQGWIEPPTGIMVRVGDLHDSSKRQPCGVENSRKNEQHCVSLGRPSS